MPGKWKLIKLSEGIRVQTTTRFRRWPLLSIQILPIVCINGANGLIWNLPPSVWGLLFSRDIYFHISQLTMDLDGHFPVARRMQIEILFSFGLAAIDAVRGKMLSTTDGGRFLIEVIQNLFGKLNFLPEKPSYVEIVSVCAILIKLFGKISPWWRNLHNHCELNPADMTAKPHLRGVSLTRKRWKWDLRKHFLIISVSFSLGKVSMVWDFTSALFDIINSNSLLRRLIMKILPSKHPDEVYGRGGRGWCVAGVRTL